MSWSLNTWSHLTLRPIAKWAGIMAIGADPPRRLAMGGAFCPTLILACGYRMAGMNYYLASELFMCFIIYVSSWNSIIKALSKCLVTIIIHIAHSRGATLLKWVFWNASLWLRERQPAKPSSDFSGWCLARSWGSGGKPLTNTLASGKVRRGVRGENNKFGSFARCSWGS